MEWCKLYATFATDPKVHGLSDRAFRRYVEAMCYATLHETDGWALWPADKFTRELEDAGLVENAVIHGWLPRQRSKAQVDAERARKRRVHLRGGVAEPPPTELDVEVDLEERTIKTELRSVPPDRPDDDQGYLAEKLSETYGQELSYAALQKLNTRYGRVIVSDALRYIRGFPPSIPPRSLYAYLEAIAKDKAATA